MLFLYFVVEVVLATFAIIKYDISEDIKQCKIEKDFDRINIIIKKKRRLSLWLLILLLLMSAFQSFDWFRACSPKSHFQTLLGQNLDNVFTGFLCFTNVAVAIACIVYLVKIITDNMTNVITEKLKRRITKIGEVSSVIKDMENTYGKVGEIVRISDDDTIISNAIIRFDNSKKLFCLGQLFSYKDILKCETYSIPIHKTTIKTVTKTSTGNTIGRALVGGVVAGPVGAIVGGVTSKKQSETIQEDVIERWEHKVIITFVNNRSITIPIDDKTAVTYYDDSHTKTIQTASDLLKKIETIVNGACDSYEYLDDKHESDKHTIKNKTYVCTTCGKIQVAACAPTVCTGCGNTVFNQKYKCCDCGYEIISNVKPNKCSLCGCKKFYDYFFS